MYKTQIMNKPMTIKCISEHHFNIIYNLLFLVENIFVKLFIKENIRFWRTNIKAVFFSVKHFKWKDIKLIVVWISRSDYISWNIYALYYFVKFLMVLKHFMTPPLLPPIILWYVILQYRLVQWNMYYL